MFWNYLAKGYCRNIKIQPGINVQRTQTTQINKHDYSISSVCILLASSSVWILVYRKEPINSSLTINTCHIVFSNTRICRFFWRYLWTKIHQEPITRSIQQLYIRTTPCSQTLSTFRMNFPRSEAPTGALLQRSRVLNFRAVGNLKTI